VFIVAIGTVPLFALILLRIALTPIVNPFAGERFYVDPDSNASRTADQWYAAGRIEHAQQIKKIADEPVVQYFEPEQANPGMNHVRAWITMVAKRGDLPVMGLYGLPLRDCGGYSKGGVTSAQAYRNWIDHVSRQIGDRKAVAILEPDGIAYWDCLTEAQQQERVDLIKYAASTLEAKPNTYVYIDAGHSGWHSPATTIERLKRAGIAQADGFTLNTSNFNWTSEEIAYGERISAGVGDKHFVIDTSRNGLGPYSGGLHHGECLPQYNPPGRALGVRPTAATGHPLVDAYFWLKRPGESDGACGPFPEAGMWMPQYALGLAKRAAY